MVPNYTNLSRSFFLSNHTRFDLSTNEGCGKYTEAFVEYARKIDPKIGHLRKNPGQTQYNGHANDAVCYPVNNGSPIYHAIDIIGAAEQPHPWKSEGGKNDDPTPNWNEDTETEYKSSDWLAEPNGESNSGNSNTSFKFPGYEELGGDNLARHLIGKDMELDYREAGQSMNDGSVVWVYQTLYMAFNYILVEHMKAEDAILKAWKRQRNGMRKVLGLSEL
jgi:hypothetical protein